MFTPDLHLNYAVENVSPPALRENLVCMWQMARYPQAGQFQMPCWKGGLIADLRVWDFTSDLRLICT